MRAAAAAFGFVAHIRARAEGAAPAREAKPGQQARRWVVERTHAGMNRFRSLLIRWAKKPENYLGLLHFACGLIAYRAAGLFGWSLFRKQVSPLGSTSQPNAAMATNTTRKGHEG